MHGSFITFGVMSCCLFSYQYNCNHAHPLQGDSYDVDIITVWISSNYIAITLTVRII